MNHCPNEMSLVQFLEGKHDVCQPEIEEHVSTCEPCRIELARIVEGEQAIRLTDTPPAAEHSDENGERASDAWNAQLVARLAEGVSREVSLPAVTRGSTRQNQNTEVEGGRNGAFAVETLTIKEPAQSVAQSSHDESVPSGFSNHRIHQLIGRGGMGEVYRATQIDLNRDVALKVLTLHRDSDRDEFQQRFSREAQVTARLDHPSIVPVYSCGENDDGICFYTMRLVRGHELKQVLKFATNGQRDWNLSRAVSVLVHVAQAMAFAHSHKVIHRDLKPSNVMVGDLGEVYVMDWGLARTLGQTDTRDIRLCVSDMLNQDGTSAKGIGTHTESLVKLREGEAPVEPKEENGDRVPGHLSAATVVWASSGEKNSDTPLMTMDGSVVGTPAYMAPEQAAGDLDRVDQRSDVYSLGAMLYQLLSGHAPHVPPNESRSSPLDVLQSVLKEAPKQLSEVAPNAPPELAAICDKAMAREPDARYVSALELANDLQAFLELRVVSAYQSGAVAEARKWIARNRIVALSSLLAVLTAVAGLVANSWLQSAANERLATANSTVSAALTREQETSQTLATTNSTLEQTVVELERSQQQEREALLAATVAGEEAKAAAASEKAALKEAQTQLAESYLNFAEQMSVEGKLGYATLWHHQAAELRVDDPDAARIDRMRAAQHSRMMSIPVTAWWDEAQLEKKEFLDWPRIDRFSLAPTERFVVQRGRMFGDTRVIDLWQNRVWGGRSFLHAVVSPDGKLVAVCPKRGVVEIRQTDSEQVLKTVELDSLRDQPELLQFSGNGRRLVIGPSPCRVWDVELDRFLKGSYDLRGKIANLGLNRAGTRLGAVPVGKAESPQLFDVTDQDGVHASNGMTVSRADLFKHVKVSPLLRRDVASADGVPIIELCPPTFSDNGASMHGADFTGNGEFLARADGCGIVRLWRVQRPESWWILPVDGWRGPVISHDSQAIFAVGDPGLFGSPGDITDTVVRDPANGQPLGPILKTGGPILDGVFSPDDSIIALAVAAPNRSLKTMFVTDGSAGSIQFWDWKKGVLLGEPIQMLAEPRCVAWHAAENLLAVVCGDGHVLKMDTLTRTTRTLLDGHSRNVRGQPSPGNYSSGGVSFSADGSLLFEFGIDVNAHAIDLKTGKVRYTFTRAYSGTQVDSTDQLGIYTATNQQTQVFRVRNGMWIGEVPIGNSGFTRLSRDGRYVLTGGGRSGNLAVWDLKQKQFAGPQIESLEQMTLMGDFIHGTPYIIVVSSKMPDQWIQVYDWQSGRRVSPRIAPPHCPVLTDLRTSPDGRFASMMAPGLGLLMLDLNSYHDDPLQGLSPQDAKLLAEINAGAIVENSRIVRLNGLKWIERWNDFCSRHPNYHEYHFRHTPPELSLRHHTLQAFLAGRAKNNAGLKFHERRVQSLREKIAPQVAPELP